MMWKNKMCPSVRRSMVKKYTAGIFYRLSRVWNTVYKEFTTLLNQFWKRTQTD
jgi:hypothetical protein